MHVQVEEQNETAGREIEDAPYDSDQDYEFVVEKIVHKRLEKDNTSKYLVKWENYPSSSNTWEPHENLGDCRDVLERYEFSRAMKIADRLESGKLSKRPKKEFKLDEILGLAQIDGEKYYLISLAGNKGQAFIRSSLANVIFPSQVIDFLSKKVVWREKEKHKRSDEDIDFADGDELIIEKENHVAEINNERENDKSTDGLNKSNGVDETNRTEAAAEVSDLGPSKADLRVFDDGILKDVDEIQPGETSEELTMSSELKQNLDNGAQCIAIVQNCVHENEINQ